MARLYLRPTGFIDAPFGFDGQAARLAGGLTWFSAVEAIVADTGVRRSAALVPVERLEAWLAALPAPLAAEGRATFARLTAPRPPLMLGARRVPLDQPQVMAILNVTPDSFSDGGTHVADPVGDGIDMAAAGAAILDVGGESTRPGAPTVWEGDEIARVVPVVEGLARGGAAVSIDTRKAAVMEAALAAGAHLVNDVSALGWDDRAAAVVAEADCPVVLMHMGAPAGKGGDPAIGVYDWLAARIAFAEAAGIARTRIIVDPGLGGGSFGKSVADNLALLNGLSLLHGLGCPILLGASRKTFIGALAGEAPPAERLGGSIAAALAGAAQGVQLFRVHDVRDTVQALRIWRGARDRALTPG